MTLRRLPDDPKWEKARHRCRHPEHQPPGMIVLEPGTYEHTCPGCGKATIFTVPPRPELHAGMSRTIDG